MTTTAHTRGRVRVEQGDKRIRAYLGGEVVADTSRPLLVWEKPYYPAYYFPAAEVGADALVALLDANASARTGRCSHGVLTSLWLVVAGQCYDGA